MFCTFSIHKWNVHPLLTHMSVLQIWWPSYTTDRVETYTRKLLKFKTSNYQLTSREKKNLSSGMVMTDKSLPLLHILPLYHYSTHMTPNQPDAHQCTHHECSRWSCWPELFGDCRPSDVRGTVHRAGMDRSDPETDGMSPWHRHTYKVHSRWIIPANYQSKHICVTL